MPILSEVLAGFKICISVIESKQIGKMNKLQLEF